MDNRWVIGLAVGILGLASLTACGSTSKAAGARLTTTTASSQPAAPAGSCPSSTPGDRFSASPFASSVSGTVVADASGKGARSLNPLPRAGSLNVVYNCSTGSMTVARKPDIKATFSCVGGPSLITFGKTKVINHNPVTVRMSNPKESWTVQMVLADH